MGVLPTATMISLCSQYARLLPSAFHNALGSIYEEPCMVYIKARRVGRAGPHRCCPSNQLELTSDRPPGPYYALPPPAPPCLQVSLSASAVL